MPESRYGKSLRVGVMDPGMRWETNTKFLKHGGRRYIIGPLKITRKQFERQLFEESWDPVREGVESKLCLFPDGDAEKFTLWRSCGRWEKERTIFARFNSRIEKGLKKIEANRHKIK